MSEKSKKLGVFALAALVISAMIGGGIFSMPQNIAQGASVMAVIAAWVISGIGIFFLASTFRILAEIQPDATAGIYAYSRIGFGKFAGFQIAWAYWLCNIFGNVAYAVLLMDAMNYFFPGTFTGGNNLWSVIGGSLVIWLMNFAVLRGTRQAAGINTVGTICKLIPLAIFIVVMIFVFRWKTFSTDMFGTETIPALELKPLGSFLGQIKSTMMVTLWAFIGIEGAVVISAGAESQQAVGRATMIGFLGCLSIYILLSLLPFGRMTQGELAALNNPSTAELLQNAVHGKWGGVLMNLGVIIALLTSWLAFTIMIAQIPYAAAKDGTFPGIFAHENHCGAPDVSLFVTSAIMQLTMIMVYFANNAWNTMLSITSVMILPPYFGCTLYLWKRCAAKNYPATASVKLGFATLCGVAGSIYALWMIYAAGLEYLAMAFIFLALGIPVFIWAQKNAGTGEKQKLFTGIELASAILIVLIALLAIIAAVTGKLSL
ncbi:MAG: amino acid permease [Lentisphaeria bacterium]|nr:amino acid permease [Lentisphaeria bacterium]